MNWWMFKPYFLFVINFFSISYLSICCLLKYNWYLLKCLILNHYTDILFILIYIYINDILFSNIEYRPMRIIFWCTRHTLPIFLRSILLFVSSTNHTTSMCLLLSLSKIRKFGKWLSMQWLQIMYAYIILLIQYPLAFCMSLMYFFQYALVDYCIQHVYSIRKLHTMSSTLQIKREIKLFQQKNMSSQ